MGHMAAPGNPITSEAGVLVRQTFSDSIGSGNTTDIISAAQNPNGAYLWHLSISSGANGGSTAFLVEDVVQDGNGNQYLACEIGLPAQGGVAHNSINHDMKGILIPAGVNLKLINGGAGGGTALRRCSATAIVSLLS